VLGPPGDLCGGKVVVAVSVVYRTVANYMLWRFVMNRVGNLQQSFLDLRRRYNKVRPSWMLKKLIKLRAATIG